MKLDFFEVHSIPNGLLGVTKVPTCYRCNFYSFPPLNWNKCVYNVLQWLINNSLCPLRLLSQSHSSWVYLKVNLMYSRCFLFQKVRWGHFMWVFLYYNYSMKIDNWKYNTSYFSVLYILVWRELVNFALF